MTDELQNNVAAALGQAVAILVLEDRSDVLTLMVEVLEGVSASVAVAGAASLAQARALLNASSFDLLIFDLNLPDGRSSELVAEIRAGQFPNIPSGVKVVMTTTAPRREIESLLKLFDEFLPKPWTIEQLQETARSWLDGKLK